MLYLRIVMCDIRESNCGASCALGTSSSVELYIPEAVDDDYVVELDHRGLGEDPHCYNK